MFGPSKLELFHKVCDLKSDVARHEREIEMYKQAVREQSEILQRLHTKLGYSLEWVPEHWELVETEDEYD